MQIYTMAKHTRRDEVWKEIIARREAGETFAKADIVDTVGASERTVHDVLRTAVEADALGTGEEQRELADARTRDGTQQQTVTIYGAPPPEPDARTDPLATGTEAVEELEDDGRIERAKMAPPIRLIGGLLLAVALGYLVLRWLGAV